ncbi:hypothetical protein, partial [Streptomyces mirabilis]|uniref:hypothetical protein n=1 Tax=Streptomyces mirabilis TaxID=68239 RepID=UPI0036C2FD46
EALSVCAQRPATTRSGLPFDAHLPRSKRQQLLKHRTDAVEKLADKLDSEKVTKFDVVTITLTILAAIGGLTGAVVALIRWVTG